MAQLAARRAHNPQVSGSNPLPASIRTSILGEVIMYSVQVDIGSRSITLAGCTRIQAQNIMESYLRDGLAEFTLTVKQEVHEHLWYGRDRDSGLNVIFECEECDETFTISQPALNVCFAGVLEARAHGF
jgi:hypothetical protein